MRYKEVGEVVTVNTLSNIYVIQYFFNYIKTSLNINKKKINCIPNNGI